MKNKNYNKYVENAQKRIAHKNIRDLPYEI